jgi:hypothetical protein
LRAVLCVVGALIILGVFQSVLRTLVIPRPTRAGYPRTVQRCVRLPFQLVADRCRTNDAKDRALAPVAAVAIIVMLLGWLGAFLIGYAVLEAGVSGLGPPSALREAGSSLFTLGFASGSRSALTAVDFLAAATGPIIIGLQVGYLPALYGAYARREAEVTLLESRAGSPPWGPEILARYAQVELLDSLVELFQGWERWAAEVSESHTTYPVLVHFRSPRPNRSWLIAVLAVMDAGALQLAFNPSQRKSEIRMALRAGFVCLRDIADTRGMAFDSDPSPDSPLELSYEAFLEGVTRMESQGFPMERTPEQAWPHFRGWRVNYESLAYALARDLDAVPAPWSGPRRTTAAILTPITPTDRKPRG